MSLLLANFRGLVLGCIEAKFRSNILEDLDEVYPIYTFLCTIGIPNGKNGNPTSPNSNIQRMFVMNFDFCFHIFLKNKLNNRQMFAMFLPICAESCPNVVGISEIV